MGGVEADTGGFQQGYRIQGRGEATVSVVLKNGGPEADDCNVNRYFGEGKGSRRGRGGGGREVAE